MTGRPGSFLASRDGGSILGPAAPATTPAPAAPTPGPVLGTGDRALGGGIGGAPPLAPNPSANPGGINAGNLGQILRTLGITQGGGGVGGAGGTAPGGIGPGQTGAESGQRFAAANAAVNPSIRSALELGSMVMSPMSIPAQLAMAQFPGLANVFGALGLPSAGGFNVRGPQLSPQQQAQIAAAYQQSPALAARLLATMRQQANIAGGAMGGGMLSGTGQTPMGSFGTMPGTSELTANFTSPGFGLNPAATGYGGYATWGGPDGGAAGGGLGGGGGPDTGGGLGGGPGNMGGGQNRSM